MTLNRKLFFRVLCLVFLLVLNQCNKEFQRLVLLSTNNVFNVTAVSVRVSGTIFDVGEGIKEHGHCWSTQDKPDIHASKTDLGSRKETGGFNSTLEDLYPNEKYYVRAYASDGGKIYYGEVKSFVTLAFTYPSVQTGSITDITISTAIANGKLLDFGSTTVTGEYISSLSGLIDGAIYYARPYATNSYGTAYGDIAVFVTGDPYSIFLGDPDLVAYYPFNNNSNDESSNGNNGILNGPVITTDRFGETNSAYEFDGIDDYISIDPVSDVSSIGNFTISLWAICDGWQEQPGIITGKIDHQFIFNGHCYSETVTSNFFKDGINISYLYETDYTKNIHSSTFDLDGNSYPIYYPTSNLIGQWHNLLFIRDGTETHLYLDGTLAASLANDGLHLDMQHKWFIGTVSGNNPVGNSFNYNFDGKIDDLLFFKRVLTLEEINIISSHKLK